MPVPQDNSWGWGGGTDAISVSPLVPLPRTMVSKLGEGRGTIVIMVGESGIGAESLASPQKEVLCKVLICFLLARNYS
jgi:hypothetical protein